MSKNLRPLSRIPICSVCKKPVTKQSELQFVADTAGNPIHLALRKSAF